MKTRTLKILAVSLGLCAAAGNLVAQVTLTTLHSFEGSDGAQPIGGLVQGNDGNFYGTTYGGNGTVFRISPSGSFTNLHTFTGTFGAGDGSHPYAALVQGSDGNFYGTTYQGGAGGNGSVFRISPSGSFTNFYSFTGGADGYYPLGGLVQGSDGNLYGTSYSDVFRISLSGSFTNLHSFSGSDGYNTYAGLVQGSDGNFYGTAAQGGSNNNGAVFQISPSGSYTNLYLFSGYISGGGDSDGEDPRGALVQGSDGNFYGTTAGGGANFIYDSGTVFRISTNGSYAILHSFTLFTNDGEGIGPEAGLVQGSDGNFYGTTPASTNGSDYGTLFRITPSGKLTTLYEFTGPADPYGALVQGSDGNFYGTTQEGGTNGVGSVFKLIVPLNPPANQISAIQVVATNVLVTLPSVAAEFYQLQSRTSLTAGSWADVAGASAKSIGGSLTVTNFGGFSQSQQFYRFAITP